MNSKAPLAIVSIALLAACATLPGRAPDAAATPTLAPSSTPAATPMATRAPTATFAPLSTEAAEYLEAAMAIMAANSLHRLELDWTELRAIATRLASGAQTSGETYSAIRYVLDKAGGPHSGFLTPKQAAALDQVTMAENLPPRAKLLLDRLGYVAIEQVIVSDPDAASDYATMAQQLIREVDAQAPCGWFVDLRQNGGGNMWPMLAALGPLLGEGIAGQFIGPGGETTAWAYDDGQALIGTEAVVGIQGPAYTLQAENPPVAVLIGAGTASSGEAVAISFIGRPNTRSFGRSTAGLATGNAGFPLSDGAVINLTTAIMADRTGRAYGTYINPDVVADDSPSSVAADESIPSAAVDWLMGQPACAAQP